MIVAAMMYDELCSLLNVQQGYDSVPLRVNSMQLQHHESYARYAGIDR